ncbi:MAG: hypothetical protein R6X25_00990 [Candidatus Krumholzibacteriia bacterium]
MNRELHSEYDAAESKPNLRYLVDASGQAWFCDADADTAAALAGQSCSPADDWTYDRNFGG